MKKPQERNETEYDWLHPDKLRLTLYLMRRFDEQKEREKMKSKSELRRKKLQWQAEAEEWRVIADELAEALAIVEAWMIANSYHNGSVVDGIDPPFGVFNVIAKYNKLKEQGLER